MREVKREGESEFQAISINEHGGIFERLLYIEWVDGIKVRSTQRLYIRGELDEVDPVSISEAGAPRKCYGITMKIVQVQVLATEEMIDGEWSKASDTREEI